MLKKVISCLFLLTTVLLVNTAFISAEEITVGDWVYTSNDVGTAENVRPVDKSILTGDIIIPETIDNKPVVSIADDAFSGNTSIESVLIPNTVVKIGNSAFANCFNVTEIMVPNSVTAIGSYAFSSCYQLSSINIPEGVQRIEYGTFSYTKLIHATIPMSVVFVDDNAFASCDSLQSVRFINPSTVINSSSSTIAVNALIEGNLDSTAQEYAKANGRIFVDQNGIKKSEVGVTSPSTIIDVTIVVNKDISIDPMTGTVTAPTIKIKNNTKSPIDVTSTGVSIKGYFNLIEPERYTEKEWGALTREQSKQIAVILRMEGQWKNVLSGEYKSNTPGSALHGTMAPGSEATIESEIKHGNSFGERVSSTLTIDWLITLE